MARRNRWSVVTRTASGGYRLEIHPDARDHLVAVLGELRDILTTADPSSPGLRRLFPAAYHDDPEADAEYQRLMREELVASRLAGVEVLTEALQRDEMTADELYVLMTSLNALRLVLGTMLDVGEDDELVPEDHPHAAELHLYDFLSVLLGHVVAALSEDLPPPRDGG